MDSGRERSHKVGAQVDNVDYQGDSQPKTRRAGSVRKGYRKVREVSEGQGFCIPPTFTFGSGDPHPKRYGFGTSRSCQKDSATQLGILKRPDSTLVAIINAMQSVQI